MKFIFSTKQIPALSGLTLRERAEKLHKAQTKLTVPEKLTLNLLKLCMLIPAFFYIANQKVLFSIIFGILSLLSYFIIFLPIKFSFLNKYLIEKSDKKN
ncbi:DUF6170 family protein [Thalassotalea profundi]|uniref:Uncharacterized protein n=1 Tax=Thalassotalea profundi TaxID=2036687 RepID=A0ABQ3IHA1_9GAMM|nr:DUF6170 family protein [Thalassotalea profundi]GHE80525.1 hypothetical protein GCM10011501_05550 [Thalassotalea profundi]